MLPEFCRPSLTIPALRTTILRVDIDAEAPRPAAQPPIHPSQCKDMYILHLPQIFSFARRYLSLWFGLKQVNSPVLTSDNSDKR